MERPPGQAVLPTRPTRNSVERRPPSTGCRSGALMPPPESSLGHDLGWEAEGSAAAFLLAPDGAHTQDGDPGATEPVLSLGVPVGRLGRPSLGRGRFHPGLGPLPPFLFYILGMGGRQGIPLPSRANNDLEGNGDRPTARHPGRIPRCPQDASEPAPGWSLCESRTSFMGGGRLNGKAERPST